MIVAEVRVVPVGAGSSMEKTVEAVADALADCEVQYEIGPVATTFQTENLDDLMKTIQCCQEAAIETAPRVILSVTVDQRRDVEEDMETLKRVGGAEVERRGRRTSARARSQPFRGRFARALRPATKARRA